MSQHNQQNNVFRTGIFINMVSVLCNSIAPVFDKYALLAINPIQAAFWVSVISFFISQIYILAKKQQISRDTIKKLLPIAVLNTLGVIFLYTSLDYLSPVTFGFLGRLYVVFTTILSVFVLREGVNKKEWGLIALILIGMFAFVYKDSDGNSTVSFTGILFAVAYTFTFALSNMFVKIRTVKIDPFVVLYMNNAGASVIVSGVLLLSNTHPLQNMTPRIFGLLFISSIFTFVALGTLFWGFRYLSFRLSNIIRGIRPITLAIVSWPFFPIPLNWLNVGGGILLVISLIGLGFIEKGKAQKS